MDNLNNEYNKIKIQREERIEENQAKKRKFTADEIDSKMQMIQDFLENDLLHDVKEMKDFFNKINPKTLEEGLFLVEQLSELKTESVKIYTNIKEFIAIIKNEKNDFEKLRGTRIMSFQKKQTLMTEELEDVIKLYKKLILLTFMTTTGFSIFFVYKLLPYLEVII